MREKEELTSKPKSSSLALCSPLWGQTVLCLSSRMISAMSRCLCDVLESCKSRNESELEIMLNYRVPASPWLQLPLKCIRQGNLIFFPRLICDERIRPENLFKRNLCVGGFPLTRNLYVRTDVKPVKAGSHERCKRKRKQTDVWTTTTETQTQAQTLTQEMETFSFPCACVCACVCISYVWTGSTQTQAQGEKYSFESVRKYPVLFDKSGCDF